MDIEICTCLCHTWKGIEHIIPCCMKCSFCGENILRAYYRKHVKRCIEKQKKEREKLFKNICKHD